MQLKVSDSGQNREFIEFPRNVKDYYFSLECVKFLQSSNFLSQLDLYESENFYSDDYTIFFG
jgi:hypothetical protein